MAVRLNPRNAESTKQKIQVTKLIQRLQNHALGQIEMTTTQIDAAKFLLNKRIPNPPTEVSGPDGGAIPVEATVRLVGATQAA
jgi:hypothetical protein